MKYLTFLLALTFIFSSCQSKKEQEEKLQKELQKAAQEILKDRIDFEMDATPKYFSAKTIDGKTFNSGDYKGKNLVVFVYDQGYLKKSDTYDMPSELNDIYDKYKDQAHFVGILDAAVEDKNQALTDMKNAGIKFDQIDNSRILGNKATLNVGIYCAPAKVLIDSKGKVVAASCGGGSSRTLLYKLDSIKAGR